MYFSAIIIFGTLIGTFAKDDLCFNKASNCKVLESHCFEKLYEETLKEYCAQTCGACNPQPEDCNDKDEKM
jgi:hypothetical protein